MNPCEQEAKAVDFEINYTRGVYVKAVSPRIDTSVKW